MKTTFLNTLENRKITIDNNVYDIFIKRNVSNKSESPKLIVVSYLPNELTRGIVDVCLKSIQKYTAEEHELWVVDNNSPKESIKWLYNLKDINVIFNRSRYVKNGSYDNGIALEIAIRIIDKKTQYIMTLHQDIMVCRKEWFGRMLSKMDDKVKAVGVELNKFRVPEGILHVVGYIIDFQVFKELGLSFLPKLPNYDVGDLAIVNLRKAGFYIYSFPNSFHNPKLIELIPDDSPLKKMYIDRIFDENNQIFFLHLGRGVVKSEGKGNFKGKTLPEEWIELGRRHILNESNSLSDYTKLLDPRFHDISYSVRRYFVDEFFSRKIVEFPTNSRILDMGGKKIKKRGQFDIEKYNLKIEYANIDKKTEPDYLCDISNIPVPDNSFDGIICSEVLEHIKEPIAVLKESFRILRPGGIILITVPFLFHIHANPYDYGRYTDHYWKYILTETGFIDVTIERQGLFWGVLMNMVKLWIYQDIKEGKIQSKLLKIVLKRVVGWAQKKTFEWEKIDYYKNHLFFSAHTTGFGIRGFKNR